MQLGLESSRSWEICFARTVRLLKQTPRFLSVRAAGPAGLWGGDEIRRQNVVEFTRHGRRQCCNQPTRPENAFRAVCGTGSLRFMVHAPCCSDKLENWSWLPQSVVLFSTCNRDTCGAAIFNYCVSALAKPWFRGGSRPPSQPVQFRVCPFVLFCPAADKRVSRTPVPSKLHHGLCCKYGASRQNYTMEQQPSNQKPRVTDLVSNSLVSFFARRVIILPPQYDVSRIPNPTG